MVSIRGFCLKLLRVTWSSCLLHFFLYIFWWVSCLGLALASFSITISTFFYRFNSRRICAWVGSTRDCEILAKEWMCMRRNLLPLTTCLEMRNSLRSGVDVRFTREEYFASFMVHGGLWRRILYFFIGEFLYGTHRGRIFYFHIGDTLGKNLLLPY